ncbi:MAG TPA: hypothetical protein VHM31_05495 [Polyangia bacterium]|nr:hypothetical protein [Polyangia bacterium]
MHPAVAGLAMEEQGFVLGTMLARRSPAEAARLAGAGDAPWRGALQELLAEPRAVRAAALAELIATAQAPIPPGLSRVHPGWLRERLGAEPSAVVRAVTDGLAIEVRRVAAEILAERGESLGPVRDWPGAAVAVLRRAVFGGLVPLAGPGAPAGPEGRALLDLSFAAVEEAVELRGAATLGASVRGAPAAVVAQAAAGLGGRLARALLDAAGRPGAPQERNEARLLVSAAAGEMSPPLAMRLGLRALALSLSREGRESALAVSQRLPPALGRRLVALAAAPWD